MFLVIIKGILWSTFLLIQCPCQHFLLFLCQKMEESWKKYQRILLNVTCSIFFLNNSTYYIEKVKSKSFDWFLLGQDFTIQTVFILCIISFLFSSDILYTINYLAYLTSLGIIGPLPLFTDLTACGLYLHDHRLILPSTSITSSSIVRGVIIWLVFSL